jgi:hypothetical protein
VLLLLIDVFVLLCKCHRYAVGTDSGARYETELNLSSVLRVGFCNEQIICLLFITRYEIIIRFWLES